MYNIMDTLYMLSMYQHVGKIMGPGVSHLQRPQWHLAVDCIYWPVLGSFNNWSTIQFTRKNKLSEDFDENHKVVIIGISDNMEWLVQLGNIVLYTTDTKITGDYVVMYVSDAFILQEDITTNWQVSRKVELNVRSEYLRSMKEKSNWYLELK